MCALLLNHLIYSNRVEIGSRCGRVCWDYNRLLLRGLIRDWYDRQIGASPECGEKQRERQSLYYLDVLEQKFDGNLFNYGSFIRTGVV